MDHQHFDQDLDLRPATDEPTRLSAPIPTSIVAPWMIAAIIIAGVIVAGYVVFRHRGATSLTSATTAAASPPTVASSSPLGAEAQPVDIPSLDDSDDVVRTLVRALSSNPSVSAWLATDNLIRNFTVVVSNIASGEPTAVQLPALKPRGVFQVEERGEDLFISPRSHARYLPLATAVSSIDPAATARLYTTLKPRIEEAYRELGHPDTPFDQTLERAIVLLLNTPVPSGPVPVEPDGGISYRFADRSLDRLNPSQKLLIRFGPDNQRAVQSSLRNVALALGIPAGRLP